jgi:GMP synthase-like glutamine amidotransferase
MIFGLYHDAGEGAGLIAEILKEEGIAYRSVHLYAGEGLPRDTSDLEGLVIMGGSMNADDIGHYPFLLPEGQLIEKVISENKPILGVCLGSQLIAKALGARVYPNAKREVGWHPITATPEGHLDPVFSTLPDSVSVLHWHGDTFDLPDGAVHLARSARCENQAFRWGESVYALQFHVEATPSMVIDWCASPEARSYVKGGGETVEKIIKDTPAAYRRLEPHARAFLKRYVRAAFNKVRSVA